MLRIVSVALLVMALFVGSASAECAWVLWSLGHFRLPGEISAEKVWTKVVGHQNLPDCEVKRTKVADGRDKLDRAFDKAMGVRPEPRTWSLARIPDTFDPRGPRGK